MEALKNTLDFICAMFNPVEEELILQTVQGHKTAVVWHTG
jgi:hypothetical protein